MLQIRGILTIKRVFGEATRYFKKISNMNRNVPVSLTDQVFGSQIRPSAAIQAIVGANKCLARYGAATDLTISLHIFDFIVVL